MYIFQVGIKAKLRKRKTCKMRPACTLLQYL